MWGYHMDMGWGWWMLGSVMMLVFWGFVAWVIASFFQSHQTRPSNTAFHSPREIADRRFAEGVIDAEEHQRIIEQLEKSRRL